MKNQLLALRSSLEKLGYKYVRSNPGLRPGQVDLSFEIPEPSLDSEPRRSGLPATKPGLDRIGEVAHLVAQAGLVAGSLGIFPATPRSAIVLRGLRIIAAATEKSQTVNREPLNREPLNREPSSPNS